MALSANSVFEVRTAGNDTNGGGFVTGAAGTDYSQQDAKNTVLGVNDSTTDAVAVGTGVITSATAVFSSAIVGNIIYLQGGTGALAAGWYQVTVFTSSVSITVDRNVAAGTGITMNIGGALASPGMAGGVGLVTGNIIYIKAGTYTIASATPNIATGCFSTALTLLIIEGYQTTRGDLGTAPLLQASGISTFTILSLTGPDSMTVNIIMDGAGLTSSRGGNLDGIVFQCQFKNCTNNGFVADQAPHVISCVATGCSSVAGAFTGVGNYVGCIAYDNTVAGFNDCRTCVRCIADSNTGATSDGFLDGAGDILYLNCVAYGNGRDGWRINDDETHISNCIAEGNGGYGFNIPSVRTIQVFRSNATFNNTSGGFSLNTGKGIYNINPITLSASPFTNAAGQDFSLNNVTGGGALARSTGYPGTLPVGGTGYLDIGALQHLGIPFFAMLGADILRGLTR